MSTVCQPGKPKAQCNKIICRVKLLGKMGFVTQKISNSKFPCYKYLMLKVRLK
jgi:hypothetical protein